MTGHMVYHKAMMDIWCGEVLEVDLLAAAVDGQGTASTADDNLIASLDCGKSSLKRMAMGALLR